MSGEYYHHGCCTGSTALRVTSLNNIGTTLNINGVYELYYDEFIALAPQKSLEKPRHRYLYK